MCLLQGDDAAHIPITAKEDSPNATSLSLVDEVASIVASNISECALVQRVPKYIEDHQTRIASGVDHGRCLVKEHDDRALQIGSSPLVLTGALKRLVYQIRRLCAWPERTAHAAKELGLKIVKSHIERDPLPFGVGFLMSLSSIMKYSSTCG